MNRNWRVIRIELDEKIKYIGLLNEKDVFLIHQDKDMIQLFSPKLG